METKFCGCDRCNALYMANRENSPAGELGLLVSVADVDEFVLWELVYLSLGHGRQSMSVGLQCTTPQRGSTLRYQVGMNEAHLGALPDQGMVLSEPPVPTSIAGTSLPYRYGPHSCGSGHCVEALKIGGARTARLCLRRRGRPLSTPRGSALALRQHAAPKQSIRTRTNCLSRFAAS